MTKREKILASVVGGVLVLLALQYGFDKYRAALKARDTRLFTLNDNISDRQMKQLEGAMAERRMGEFIMRSLPSNLERAQSDYTRFLSNLVSDVGLAGASASFTNAIPTGDQFVQLNYQVSGTGDLEQLVELLYGFHRMYYLHRIQNLNVAEVQGRLRIEMDVQALSLVAAPPDLAPPSTPAPRLAANIDHYLTPILNRNPIAPPNQPPRFAAESSTEGTVGSEVSLTARFEDPDEGQNVQYALVGEVPEGVQLDPETGRLRMRAREVGNYEVTVRATDDGWPAKSAEQKLVIRVVDPPPAPEPEPAAEKYNEARQTFLTGLTESRGQWTAMLHVRTRGQTLRLREGDSFEIGQMRGTVVEVANNHAVLESDGQRFTLRFDTSLAEAATSVSSPRGAAPTTRATTDAVPTESAPTEDAGDEEALTDDERTETEPTETEPTETAPPAETSAGETAPADTAPTDAAPSED